MGHAIRVGIRSGSDREIFGPASVQSFRNSEQQPGSSVSDIESHLPDRAGKYVRIGKEFETFRYRFAHLNHR